MIDMSDLLNDPLFIEPITVQKSRMIRDNHGRIRGAYEDKEIYASVQPVDGQALQALPNLQAVELSDLKTVYSKLPLSAGDAYQLPDRIIYHGLIYEVVSIEDHTLTGNYTKATIRRVKNDNIPI